MANYVIVTLDTTGPANPAITLENGAIYTSDQLIDASISTDDSVTSGYQMKLWGDVDTTANANIQTTEELSSWISFSSTQQIKLSSTDGLKTVYCKIRDDVYNESSQVSDSITLDTSLPSVTTGTPDRAKISKQAGVNQSSFTWQSDEAFSEYKIKRVPATSSPHDSGTQIPIDGGSQNVSGTGSFEASTNITTMITGADLQTVASIDGDQIIKVFVKDLSGQWST